MTSLKKKKFYVDIRVDGESLRIYDDQVASVVDKVFEVVGITRADLGRAFAEAKELMTERGLKPGGRIRPVVDQAPDGSWCVVLVEEGVLPELQMMVDAGIFDVAPGPDGEPTYRLTELGRRLELGQASAFVNLTKTKSKH
jgi:hypothetical protein